MTNKILISILCTGSLLLTACGGGSSDSTNNQTQYTSKEKLDYNKMESIRLITRPVVNLSNQYNNLLLKINTVASSNSSCISGTKTTKDNSVTFNNCQILVDDKGTMISVSGNLQTNMTISNTSVKNELTLTNINIDMITQSVSVNGKLTYTSTTINNDLTQTLFESNQATYKLIDRTNNNHIYQYTLNNYTLPSNLSKSTGNIEDVAKGQLSSESDGKIFSVNFNSNFNFSTKADLDTLKPNTAQVEITDLYNQQNTISITQTINGQALVNTYANSKLVENFPQTVNWSDFY